MNAERKTGRGRALAVLLALGALALFVIALVSAFKLGMATAFAAAGGALIVYQLPATIFDWPRLMLEDVGAFFEAALNWFTGLFDW